MQLANSIALTGLAGLVIPIVIWLLSRKKQELIKFGTLQFLQEVKSPSARSIFPSQWIPLLLRCIIIILASVFLAQPLFKSSEKSHKTYIEKAIYNDPNFQAVLMDLDDEPEIFKTPSLNLFIRKLNRESTSATVYTRNLLKDYLGSNAPLREGIEWITVPFYEGFSANDSALIKNEAYLTKLISDEDGLRWESEKQELDIAPDSLAIHLLASHQKQAEKDFLIKLMKSYEKVLPLRIREVESNADLLIAIDTVTHLLYQNVIHWQQFKGALQLKTVTDNQFKFYGNPSESDLASSNFALDLAHELLNIKLNLKSIDRRVASTPVAKPTETLSVKEERRSERKAYWIIPLLVVLAIERGYAYKFAET